MHRLFSLHAISEKAWSPSCTLPEPTRNIHECHIVDKTLLDLFGSSARVGGLQYGAESSSWHQGPPQLALPAAGMLPAGTIGPHVPEPTAWLPAAWLWAAWLPTCQHCRLAGFLLAPLHVQLPWPLPYCWRLQPPEPALLPALCGAGTACAVISAAMVSNAKNLNAGPKDHWSRDGGNAAKFMQRHKDFIIDTHCCLTLSNSKLHSARTPSTQHPSLEMDPRSTQPPATHLEAEGKGGAAKKRTAGTCKPPDWKYPPYTWSCR